MENHEESCNDSGFPGKFFGPEPPEYGTEIIKTRQRSLFSLYLLYKLLHSDPCSYHCSSSTYVHKRNCRRSKYHEAGLTACQAG
jgi:hypothetical protein